MGYNYITAELLPGEPTAVESTVYFPGTPPAKVYWVPMDRLMEHDDWHASGSYTGALGIFEWLIGMLDTPRFIRATIDNYTIAIPLWGHHGEDVLNRLAAYAWPRKPDMAATNRGLAWDIHDRIVDIRRAVPKPYLIITH